MIILSMNAIKFRKCDAYELNKVNRNTHWNSIEFIATDWKNAQSETYSKNKKILHALRNERERKNIIFFIEQ